jgi:hypothetical protein
MTIKIRKYRRGGFEVDIRFTWPDRTPFRQRVRSPVASKSASQRWGEARELELLRAGKASLDPPKQEKEVPTLKGFEQRFMDGYAKANRAGRPKTSAHAGVRTVRRCLRMANTVRILHPFSMLGA